MTTTIRQWIHRVTLLLGGGMAASSVQAQQASIGGVVTDQATGDPLEAAQVILVGQNRVETTSQEGRYLFHNVPPRQLPGSYAASGLQGPRPTARPWPRAKR